MNEAERQSWPAAFAQGVAKGQRQSMPLFAAHPEPKILPAPGLIIILSLLFGISLPVGLSGADGRF